MVRGNIHNANRWERGKLGAGWRACSWNAAYVTHLIFLRGCALVNDELLTCYTGEKYWVRKSLLVPPVGLWVKAEKWRAAKLRKRRGEIGRCGNSLVAEFEIISKQTCLTSRHFEDKQTWITFSLTINTERTKMKGYSIKSNSSLIWHWKQKVALLWN